jgi:hypothetical protein
MDKFMEMEKTLMDENEKVIASLGLFALMKAINRVYICLGLRFIALSNLFLFPQVSCFNLFILMCSNFVVFGCCRYLGMVDGIRMLLLAPNLKA